MFKFGFLRKKYNQNPSELLVYFSDIVKTFLSLLMYMCLKNKIFRPQSKKVFLAAIACSISLLLFKFIKIIFVSLMDFFL